MSTHCRPFLKRLAAPLTASTQDGNDLDTRCSKPHSGFALTDCHRDADLLRAEVPVSRCAAFHGHRYVAEITCTAPSLDDRGRIVDFGVIKERVGTWIDQTWDHTALLMRTDPDPAIAAIAASTALPPFARMSAPMREAILFCETTMPSRPITGWWIER